MAPRQEKLEGRDQRGPWEIFVSLFYYNRRCCVVYRVFPQGSPHTPSAFFCRWLHRPLPLPDGREKRLQQKTYFKTCQRVTSSSKEAGIHLCYLYLRYHDQTANNTHPPVLGVVCSPMTVRWVSFTVTKCYSNWSTGTVTDGSSKLYSNRCSS